MRYNHHQFKEYENKFLNVYELLYYSFNKK